MKTFKKFLEEENVILKGGSTPKKKAPQPKEEELDVVDTTPAETKTSQPKTK
jgi:hypothetical protein